MRGGCHCDEELAAEQDAAVITLHGRRSLKKRIELPAVGARSSVGHGQEAVLGMLELEVLVCELCGWDQTG